MASCDYSIPETLGAGSWGFQIENHTADDLTVGFARWYPYEYSDRTSARVNAGEARECIIWEGMDGLEPWFYGSIFFFHVTADKNIEPDDASLFIKEFEDGNSIIEYLYTDHDRGYRVHKLVITDEMLQ
jgi:hypothetical protein